jgi:hypothetical protein
MSKSLKFENTADLMDVIKCYDFQPIRDAYGNPDREDRYVVGRVIGIGRCGPDGTAHRRVKPVSDTYQLPSYSHYEICVIAASHGQYKIDSTVFVPHEIAVGEYDGRVSLWCDGEGSWWDAVIRQQVSEDVNELAYQVDRCA